MFHTFQKFPEGSNVTSNLLSKSFGNLQWGKPDWGGGILMKLGDKDISSTSEARIGSVENLNIHKTFAHL